jgi:glycosyltransferase involved in cell wall biosynthesis
MLSILIPVYAYDVGALVSDLHHQAQALSFQWEIRLLDDASGEVWQLANRPLADLAQVYYEELPENIGRAAIRNRLAEQANYDYLLFMDCDSGVDHADFLSLYCQHLPSTQVICGGRTYEPTRPPLPYRLHWHYGRQREVRSAAQRSKHPYEGFMTNNFVLPRRIYQNIQLDERLKQYGHEDTLFGLELAKAGIPLKHINNPLLHLGLEPADSWLRKQQQAIQNLYELYLDHPHLRTRALNTWRWLHHFGLFRLGYNYLQKKAVKWKLQLTENETPKLLLLDVLKVLWLEEAHRAHQP